MKTMGSSCMNCIVYWIVLSSLIIDVRTSNITRSTILESIFNGYDRRLPPKYNRTGFDQQVVVETNLYIISMFSVSEANMDYSMSMYLRERWLDERLAYDNFLNLSRLELDVTSIDDVWKPDMFISNEKSSYFHTITVPNKLMHIYSDGTIQYSMRVTGAFNCLMFLQKYPFDNQECFFEAESYGHSTETIKFVWTDDDGVTIADGIQFPQFVLRETKSYVCDKEYYGIVYPCVGVKFSLVRNYSYHITQIYIPSILIVFLSWVNFWLDPNSVPARISLALLTVLTMTTQSSGAKSNLPQVSYVKAIDVWMASCLAFVFMGLIEFALVNVKSRVVTKRRSIQNNGTPPPPETNEKTEEINIEIKSQCQWPCARHFKTDPARGIDKTARWLFPLAFLIFNIVYWIFYLTWVPDIPSNKREI